MKVRGNKYQFVSWFPHHFKLFRVLNRKALAFTGLEWSLMIGFWEIRKRAKGVAS